MTRHLFRILTLPNLWAGSMGALLLTGCASMSSKSRTELSEEVQRLTEIRDTCTQYAGWVTKDLDRKSPEYREALQLYIEASSAANAYVESLRFDIISGSSFSADRYAEISKRVSDSSGKFLNQARQSLGIGKTRGLPLLIPAAIGLVELAGKLNTWAKEASEHQRELIARSLAETKWKVFQDVNAPTSGP